MNHRSCNNMKAWSSNLLHGYQRKQLAHCGGKYSIERMLALEEYTRTTSLFRALLVIIGGPFVVIALVLCQESVPLQDPTVGWEFNYGFWYRVWFTGFAIANACARQIGFWLDVPPLSSREVGVYCTCVASGFVGSGVLLANIWAFPVPFFFPSLSLVTSATLVGMLRLVLGTVAFWRIASQRTQLSRLNKISAIQGTMCFLYPIYQVVFNKVSHTSYELPVYCALPVFKFVMKAIFASSASHKEDMIPAQVVFTVDFFDAFYFSTFMQTMSLSTLTVILAFDMVDTLIELREVHERTRHITASLNKTFIDDQRLDPGSLLATTRTLCSARSSTVRMSPKISLRSCIFHRLSVEGRALLTTLEGSRSVSTNSGTISYQGSLNKVYALQQPASPVSAPTVKFRDNLVAILPHPLSPTKGDGAKSTVDVKPLGKALSRGNCSSILEETLEVLFTSESIVLTEYVEVFIPLFYAGLLLAMVNLPSAQYHTDMVGITRENVGSVVSRMFLLALLELVSFVVLAIVMKRHCGLNALYQLAFVLETQMSFILITLMLWILFTLTFRVVHFGADFSFQFEWIK